jgi:folate-binding protein YgfZ
MMTLDPRRALTTAAAFLDRSDRVRLSVSGPDRAKFLHNLTTNDVKRLAPGRGAEAFVTSPQGKTLGFVTILVGEDRIDVLTDPGGAGHLSPHFAKYGVFDDVSIEDVGPRTFEYHLAGPGAVEVLGRLGAGLPEEGDLRHVDTTVAGHPARVVQESPLGVPGLTVIGDREHGEAVRAAMAEGGGVPALDAAAAEALRIEAGTPAFGRDVTAENLPQEVGRDARAINFVKGCYLGQETVARIDALGHVNKHLRGLVFPGLAGAVPPAGSAIEAGGKAVGALTSSAFSPWRGSPVALGYVRTAQATAGTAVEVVAGGERWPAVVTDLPMPAEGDLPREEGSNHA